MKPNPNPLHCGILAALTLAFLAGGNSLIAQDNIVALGRVNSVGTLLNSDNTVGGSVLTLQNGTGDYTVTVTAPGAFAGASISDFVPKVAVRSSTINDHTIKSNVTAVTDDLVTFVVRIDDVEDTANPNGPLPENAPFDFVLMRIPSAFPAKAGTRYLIGTGRVLSNGTLSSGLGVDGITVSSVSNGVGDYLVTLAKPGGFVGDVANDYVLALTVRGTGTQDQAIRGTVSSTASDDQVVFRVRTIDVQANPDADLGVPENDSFYFTVYQIPETPEALPASKLLVALARIQGNGTLLSTPNSFDGGALLSTRHSAGNYTVTILSPGAFAGRSASEFIAHANLNQGVSADEAIRSNVTIPDDNTLHVSVNINDVEQSGEVVGVPTDAGFFVSLLDSRAVYQPDLRIGRKPNPAKMTGNDRYNNNGAGQQLRLVLNGTRRTIYSFALENDGNVSEGIRLREAGAGSRVRTNYFRITGGRTNLTAKMKKAGAIEDSVNPDALIRYQGRVKYLSTDKRPRRKIRILARSEISPSARDTVRLRVRPE